MPLLQVTSNSESAPEVIEATLRQCAKACCDILSKPTDYMQTAFLNATVMTMGARQGACIFAELKSIGLAGDSVQQLSEALTTLLAEGLEVAPQNVYLVFQDAPRENWAWNGNPFG
jgi:phenylpyruvate tautomerase PptA (4-oxalocrotonate tautomerase family)